jgi:Trypsin-co-occurring domain 1
VEPRTEVVAIQLESGQVIHAEATVVGRQEEDVADIKVPKTIDGLTSAIEGVAQAVLAALGKVQPEKGSVEFGVEIGVESGQLTALLVKGSGSASIKVALEWSRSGPPPPPRPSPQPAARQ